MKSTFEEGRRVVELRPSGPGRWIGAIFLSVWLVGWAMGEAFGLSLLIALIAPALGFEIHGLPKVPSGAGAWAMGGFVLLWLSFWTLGGLLAIGTVLSSLWGVDRIEWDATGVRRVSRVGPFRRERRFDRDAIRGVTRRRTSVVLETARGPVTLTGFGTRQDHDQLRAEIEQSLGLASRSQGSAELPPGWEAAIDLEGMPVLQRSASRRRRQATFVTALFLALGTATTLLIGGAPSGSNAAPWVPALVIGLLAAAAGAGTAWLWFGGEAIRLRAGEADVLRWFGSRRWLRHYAPASIHLEHSVDSDGDDWYKLVLRDPSGARTLARTLRDSYEVEQIGDWIASRLGTELQKSEGPRRVA
jgi:hypothetical protein